MAEKAAVDHEGQEGMKEENRVGRPTGSGAGRSGEPQYHPPLRSCELSSSSPRPPDPCHIHEALIGFALDAQGVLNDQLDRLLAEAEAVKVHVLAIEGG